MSGHMRLVRQVQRVDSSTPPRCQCSFLHSDNVPPGSFLRLRAVLSRVSGAWKKVPNVPGLLQCLTFCFDSASRLSEQAGPGLKLIRSCYDAGNLARGTHGSTNTYPRPRFILGGGWRIGVLVPVIPTRKTGGSARDCCIRQGLRMSCMMNAALQLRLGPLELLHPETRRGENTGYEMSLTTIANG